MRKEIREDQQGGDKMATLTLVDGQDSRTLVVQGRLAIQDAARLKEILLEAGGGTKPVLIDASQAESIDLACVQLVCSAHRTFAKTGRRIEFQGTPSTGVLRAWADMAIDPTCCSDDLRSHCVWKKGA